MRLLDVQFKILNTAAACQFILSESIIEEMGRNHVCV